MPLLVWQISHVATSGCVALGGVEGLPEEAGEEEGKFLQQTCRRPNSREKQMTPRLQHERQVKTNSKQNYQ